VSTLTITLSRTELALSPLILSGSDDANAIGITNYQEPPRQSRVAYAPDSAYVHGSTALAGVWQQSILAFDIVTDQAATEAASRTLVASVLAAIGQFSYTATVVVDGAPSEAWACDMGSMTGPPRDYFSLQGHDPVWSVLIPCHPLPTIGA
jgi:hypothetical protein